MIALTRRLPRKSSRTSTQAVTVPKTAFSSATTIETPSVSFSAAIASGEVATDQNCWSPFWREAQKSAAIGRRTITLRYDIVKPSERAAAAAPSFERRRVLRPTAAAWALLASGRSSDRALDRDHAPLVRVEPDIVGVAPAADDLVVDLEDARACGELPGVLL